MALSTSQRSLRPGNIVVVAGCVALIMFFALYWSPGWRFARRYERLEIGLSRDALVALFGREPDVECEVQSAVILYYRRGGIFDSPTPANVSKRVGTREQIPNLYAHAQLLLDSKGRLAAYTLNGETTAVITALGTFRGSDLRVLDDSTWNQLLAR